MKQKAIIILTPGFPADENDTACLPERELFTKFLQLHHPGVKVIVLSLTYPFFKKKYSWNEVEVFAFNGNRKKGIRRRLLWLSVWRKLLSLHKEYDINSVLSYWLNGCAYLAEKFSKFKDVPHYCWLLGQDAKPGNKFVKKIKPSALQLVAISETLAETFYKNYNIRPAHIIPAAIDENDFEFNTNKRSIDIISVGSLIPLKNHLALIDVIGSVADAIPSVTALICGKGPEENNIREKIKSLGLEENISLTGELPRREILQLMHRSRILLHTSDYEGFGLVLIEALYAGAHVISFTKPMHQPFDHFTLVSHNNEMSEAAILLLQSSISHDAVATYNINDSIKFTSELLNIQDAYVEINLPAIAVAES